MEEIHNATGTVELITERKVQTPYGEKDAYNLALSDKETYSGFGKCPYKEGENVAFRFKVKGQYKNIVSDKKGNFVDFKSAIESLTERVTKLEEKVFQKKS